MRQNEDLKKKSLEMCIKKKKIARLRSILTLTNKTLPDSVQMATLASDQLTSQLTDE